MSGFAYVAMILFHWFIKKRVVKIQQYAKKVMGVLLIGLGLKLAFSSTNNLIIYNSSNSIGIPFGSLINANRLTVTPFCIGQITLAP